MYEKHRLEWPIAKYFTQPRRIGLIFSITPPTGWEREARKISLSLSSNAVRFLPLGNNSGIHRPRWLRMRRNSNPRNPKLSPCSRSTLIYLHLQLGQLLPQPLLHRLPKPLLARVRIHQDHQIIGEPSLFIG